MKQEDNIEEFDVVIKITNTDNYRLRPKKATSSNSATSNGTNSNNAFIPSRNSLLAYQSLDSSNMANLQSSKLDTFLSSKGFKLSSDENKDSLPSYTVEDVKNLLIYPLFGYASRDCLVVQIVKEKKTIEGALNWMKQYRYPSYQNATKAFKLRYPNKKITDFRYGYIASFQKKP